MSSIDRLSGTDQVRLGIDKGLPADEIVASWAASLKSFDAARRKHLLYR